MAQHNFGQPRRLDVVDACVACGYDLSGLPDAHTCPECGAAYDAGALEVQGIVGRVKSPGLARRGAWIAVLTLLTILLYGWPLLLRADPLLAGGVALAGLGGGAALLATSSRERQGRERVMLTAAGAVRKPLDRSSQADRAFVPFPPGAGADLRRVSSRWARLRVGVRASPAAPVRAVVLDIGFACDPEHWELAVDTMQRLLRDEGAVWVRA